jgi:enoyl-CoA hydratase/carnithine racemase
MAVEGNKIVSYESNKKVATIRINRADRLNALNEDVRSLRMVTIL